MIRSLILGFALFVSFAAHAADPGEIHKKQCSKLIPTAAIRQICELSITGEPPSVTFYSVETLNGSVEIYKANLDVFDSEDDFTFIQYITLVEVGRGIHGTYIPIDSLRSNRGRVRITRSLSDEKILSFGGNLGRLGPVALHEFTKVNPL